MPSELFSRCSVHLRRAEAADLGCAVEDFDANTLVVVPRPAKVLYPEYAALIVSFGTGTVVSVDAPYLDWVRANPPSKHYRAFTFSFLGPLEAEIRRTGLTVAAGGTSLCFALAEEPASLPFPSGFTLSQRDEAWMESQRAHSDFHNALGEPDEDDWFDRLRTAFVVTDEDGTPVACAAWADDGNGCAEVGLDVRREWRARGLARPLVLAATRWALDAGYVPYYSCGAANVRSHLVAESCGYRPLWTVAGVARVTEGVGSQGA